MFGECEWLHGYPSMWYDLLCYMGFHVIHQFSTCSSSGLKRDPTIENAKKQKKILFGFLS